MNLIESMLGLLSSYNKNISSQGEPQQQQQQQQQQTALEHNSYPEVFFTNSQKCKSENNNPSEQTQPFNQSFNFSLLKNILPILAKNGSKPNALNLISNINPNLSQIFSLLSSSNKSKKEPTTNSTSKQLIDISEFSETN